MKHIGELIQHRITCQKCRWQGWESEAIVRKSGIHKKASCPICRRCIKFIKSTPPDEWIMHVGKYKGEKIAKLCDKDYEYMLWAYEEMMIPDGDAIREYMDNYIK